MTTFQEILENGKRRALGQDKRASVSDDISSILKEADSVIGSSSAADTSMVERAKQQIMQEHNKAASAPQPGQTMFDVLMGDQTKEASSSMTTWDAESPASFGKACQFMQSNEALTNATRRQTAAGTRAELPAVFESAVRTSGDATVRPMFDSFDKGGMRKVAKNKDVSTTDYRHRQQQASRMGRTGIKQFLPSGEHLRRVAAPALGTMAAGAGVGALLGKGTGIGAGGGALAGAYLSGIPASLVATHQKAKLDKSKGLNATGTQKWLGLGGGSIDEAKFKKNVKTAGDTMTKLRDALEKTASEKSLLEAENAHLKNREQAVKLAEAMEEKGYQDHLSFDEKVASALDSGNIDAIEAALAIVSGSTGFTKMASISSDGETYRSNVDPFTSFINSTGY